MLVGYAAVGQDTFIRHYSYASYIANDSIYGREVTSIVIEVTLESVTLIENGNEIKEDKVVVLNIESREKNEEGVTGLVCSIGCKYVTAAYSKNLDMFSIFSEREETGWLFTTQKRLK